MLLFRVIVMPIIFFYNPVMFNYTFCVIFSQDPDPGMQIIITDYFFIFLKSLDKDNL